MLAVGVAGLGLPELLIIFGIIVLIFGVGKLADVGGALGKSVREFRKAAREPEQEDESNQSEASPMELTCGNCGAQTAAEAEFCAKCGSPLRATVN